MNFNTQQCHSCSSHTQSFITHASLKEIHPVHVFSELVQTGQIITMITTRSRCCFSLSSNKQLRHTPQDSRSQTTQEMNTTRAYHRHDPNQPPASTIFLITSFNETTIITSTVSHQRRLRSIISQSKVSVVRSRSPPFWISSRKHFTSNILFRSIPYQYPRASRCIPNSFIYLSFDIFDTFRKNVRDVA